jgi:hypothetical protein
MKDAGGRVIYVGKAVNLQSRLRSYFGPTPRGNNKVMAMISHVRDFDYVVLLFGNGSTDPGKQPDQTVLSRITTSCCGTTGNTPISG